CRTDNSGAAFLLRGERSITLGPHLISAGRDTLGQEQATMADKSESLSRTAIRGHSQQSRVQHGRGFPLARRIVGRGNLADTDKAAGEPRPLVPFDRSTQARTRRPHEGNGRRLAADHLDELSVQEQSLSDVPVTKHSAARELVAARGKRGEIDAAPI